MNELSSMHSKQLLHQMQAESYDIMSQSFFSCYHLFLGHLLCISQYFIFSFNICQGYNFDDSFLGADNVAIIPHTGMVDWGEGGNYAWALRPATFHLILQYPQCSDLWI